MDSSSVIEIDEQTFSSEVIESDVPFLLDFTAKWCGPCRALAPTLEKIAIEQTGKVRVGKLDIDASPELARRFGIRGAPTVVAFRGGREIGRQLGLCNERTLLGLLEG